MAFLNHATSLVLTAACLFVPTAAEHKAMRGVANPAPARKLHLSCWTSVIAGLFMDVDVSCGFPPVDQVTTEILEHEAHIVKISSEAYITPNMSHLDIMVLPESIQTSDLKNNDISDLLMPHNDTCAGHIEAKNGTDVYNNIKKYVDSFDIYTKCTKVYVPNQVNGTAKMRKDDVIAIATEPFPNHFTLSYEDVAQYEEYTDSDGTKNLIAIITSRKENVIEGNYDVTVQLFQNETVRLAYTKRQNLAEAALRLGISQAGYIIATQDSVDRTMLKLAYAGRYGQEALDEDSGCYERKWCENYSTLSIGESCNFNQECLTGNCKKTNRWCWFSCNYVCAAQ